MKLTADEKGSPLWRKLRKQFEADLEELRISLESDHPMERTARLRGEIKRIRYVLSLDTSPATTHEADDE
jgi:hypothetical protein